MDKKSTSAGHSASPPSALKAKAPGPSHDATLEETPAATTADVSSEGLIAMAEVATPPAVTAENAKLLGEELETRAGFILDRSAKISDSLQDLTKGNVDAFVASGEAATAGIKRLRGQAADYGKKRTEAAASAIKRLATVKSPVQLFELQSDYIQASFVDAADETSRLVELWVKLAQNVFEPLSSRPAIVVEKIRSVSL